MQTGDYAVSLDLPQDEKKLIDFLKFNGFEYADRFENNPQKRKYLIVVNAIHRTYFRIDMYFLTCNRLSVDEFLKRVNYYENANLEHKRLFSDEGDLIYEGYTINDKPFGLGTSYFDDGNIYQKGVFDFKGIVEGREYYPTGQIKFEGIWSITTGYGPNAPRIGNLFSQNGDLIFSGKFEIKRGGVGYPMIKYPKFGRTPENRPKIKFVRSEDLIGVKSRSSFIN